VDINEEGGGGEREAGRDRPLLQKKDLAWFCPNNGGRRTFFRLSGRGGGREKQLTPNRKGVRGTGVSRPYKAASFFIAGRTWVPEPAGGRKEGNGSARKEK